MEVTSVAPDGRQIVQGYHPGGFVVAGKRLEGAILVLPDRTLPWPVVEPDLISLEDFSPVTSADPPVELLILGCGAKAVLVPQAVRHDLKSRGVALEAMATPAACRTYNVLLAEDRRVAAALIAV
ncbi:MAG: Mth938-like domain-containing protein [Pseudomonadota bacterium]